MNLKKTLSLICLFFAVVVSAQVSFTAKVNKQKIGMNERLKVVFEMNEDGDDFESPNFNGFRVVSGPSQSVSRSWINGKSTYSKSYTYYLTPTKVGNFTLGQARIKIKGETYKTTPIKIQVTSAVSNPSEGVSPNYVADNNIHLVAIVNNKTPYLNEAVSLEYRLYWDYNSVQINAPREIDSPKFKDFWSQDIEIKELKAEEGTYKGKAAAYVTLKKVVLYPQKTGKLDITPITLNVPVQVPTNRRDIFGRRMMETVNKSVSAGKTSLNVKALPANAPTDFNGAVGDFKFSATQSKKSLNATESLQIKLQVSGKGNLKLFKLPELKAPNSIEVYDPEHNESIKIAASGMWGTITDNYTLVPQYKGKFPLPSLSFSYFNPKQGQYKTVNVNNLSIDVLQGPNAANGAVVNTPSNNTVQQPVEQTNASFGFIKTEANLKPISKEPFFKTNLFWCLLLLPLLAIPIVILITKKTEALANDVEGSKTRAANKLVKKYLSSAKKNLGDSANFYVSLEKALHNYLKAKLKIETNEMNKDRISELLNSKGVSNDPIKLFIELLESCEMSRYTPATVQTMEQDFEKASNTISQIDKQL